MAGWVDEVATDPGCDTSQEPPPAIAKPELGRSAMPSRRQEIAPVRPYERGLSTRDPMPGPADRGDPQRGTLERERHRPCADGHRVQVIRAPQDVEPPQRPP